MASAAATERGRTAGVCARRLSSRSVGVFSGGAQATAIRNVGRVLLPDVFAGVSPSHGERLQGVLAGSLRAPWPMCLATTFVFSTRSAAESCGSISLVRISSAVGPGGRGRAVVGRVDDVHLLSELQRVGDLVDGHLDLQVGLDAPGPRLRACGG